MPGFNVVWSLAWGHDGRDFVVSGRDLKGRGGVYRIDAEKGKTTLLVENQRFGIMVAESPDGRYIYYSSRASAEAEVAFVRLEVATRQETILYQGKQWSNALVQSPDGRYLIAMQIAKRAPVAVLAIPTDGGAARELIRVSESQWAGLFAFTPDGKAAIVRKVLSPGSVELWRYPLDGGEPRKMEGGSETPGVLLFVHPDGKRVVFTTNVPASPSEVWALENFLPVKGGSN